LENIGVNWGHKGRKILDFGLLSEDVARHLSEIRHAFWRKDLRSKKLEVRLIKKPNQFV
jgi:hypothetical protein